MRTIFIALYIACVGELYSSGRIKHIHWMWLKKKKNRITLRKIQKMIYDTVLVKIYKVNSDFYPRKNLFLINLSLFLHRRSIFDKQQQQQQFIAEIENEVWWESWFMLRDIALLWESICVWPQVVDGFIIGDREMSNARVNKKGI